MERNFEIELSQLNGRVLNDQDMDQYVKDVKELGVAIKNEIDFVRQSLIKLQKLFQVWNEAHIDTCNVNKSLQDTQERYSYLISCEKKVNAILKAMG